MKLSTLLSATVAMAAIAAMPAQAAVKDNPHFKVLGLVVVWGADDYSDNSGAAPVVSDFIISDGANGTDLIDTDVVTVMTGSLTPTSNSLANASVFDIVNDPDGIGSADVDDDGVMDVADGFSKFAIDADTDVSVSDAVSESSFYVASNTDFDIFAEVTSSTATNFELSDVAFEMDVTQSGDDGLAFGASAQVPHTTAGFESVATLDDLTTSTRVYDGERRTAATVGSIADQSVRFDVAYTLGGTAGYDLSMGAGEIEAEVTYTVYVP